MERRVTVLGQRIAFEERGCGQPVVLLHGLGADRSVWRETLRRLSQKFRVIAADMIGFGASDKPLVPYRAGTFVEFAFGLLDELGIEKADVVGNSLGGWVAASMALAEPARLGRLVLVAPAFLYGLPPGASVRQMELAANPSTLDGMRAYLGRVMASGTELPDEEVRRHLESRLARGDGYAISAVLNSVADGVDLLTGKLGQIAAKTLVVHGSHDQVVTFEQSERVRGELAKASFLLLGGPAHWPQLEEPDAFAETLAEFLGKM